MERFLLIFIFRFSVDSFRVAKIRSLCVLFLIGVMDLDHIWREAEKKRRRKRQTGGLLINQQAETVDHDENAVKATVRDDH